MGSLRSFWAKLAIFAFVWLASGLAACAGDRALIDYLGFSHDLKYFAFEEYGISDGSGFPYSNLYIINLATDGWAPGSPYVTRAENADLSLAEVRAKTRKAAEHQVNRAATAA